MDGTLTFYQDRPDIVCKNGSLYGGLHCGDCFFIYDEGWTPVRLELLEDWVLVYDGHCHPIRYGVRAKIE